MNSAVGSSFEVVFLEKKVLVSLMNSARDPLLFQLNARTHIFHVFQTQTWCLTYDHIFYFDTSFSHFIFYFSPKEGDYSLSLSVSLSLSIYIYIYYLFFFATFLYVDESFYYLYNIIGQYDLVVCLIF